MRGLYMIFVFYLLAGVVFANTVTIKCPANQVAVGMAVRYVLDQGGYQTVETFDQGTLIYQTDSRTLTREETARYLSESSVEAPSVRLIVSVRTNGRNQSAIDLEAIFVTESPADKKSTLVSSGLLEKELSVLIQKTVERFQKVPSLN